MPPKKASTSDKPPDFEPMLAKDYKHESKKIKFPVVLQPKLDGVRLIAHVAEDGVEFSTRNAKDASTGVHPQLRAELESLRLSEATRGHGANYYLDGEMYEHDVPFQQLVHRFKKPGKDEYLAYHVFDMYDPSKPDMPFVERYEALRGAIKPSKFLKLVPTTRAKDLSELEEAHAAYLSERFEGTMIRVPDAPYRQKRTSDLVKRKDFDTEEFRIVDAVAGTGAHEGAVVWVLESHSTTAKRFNAVMKATLEERREMYSRRQTYIGKMLTVRFQGYSLDGTPRFPVGIAIRDYE